MSPDLFILARAGSIILHVASALPESLVSMSMLASMQSHEVYMYNLPTGEHAGSGGWAICTRPAEETHLHKVSQECVSRSHGHLVCSLVSRTLLIKEVQYLVVSICSSDTVIS